MLSKKLVETTLLNVYIKIIYHLINKEIFNHSIVKMQTTYINVQKEF